MCIMDVSMLFVTLKKAINKGICIKKKNWINFDTSPSLNNIDLTDELLKFVVEVANGTKTKNKINGYEEILILRTVLHYEFHK